MKFLIIAAVLFSSLPSFSQVKTEKKPKNRTCRVIFLERPKGAPDSVQLFDGEVSQKVQMPTMNFSEAIKFPEGNLVLGMTPDPVLDPESFPSGAPTLKVPEKVTDFYIVVISDSKNKIFPVRMLLVDVSDEEVKAGETIWINFTNDSIGGKLGESEVRIPAKSKVVGKAPLSKSGYYKASFFYQQNGEGNYLPIMNKSWWFDAKSKNLGFIIKTGARLPKIFTFRDRPDSLITNEKNTE